MRFYTPLIFIFFVFSSSRAEIVFEGTIGTKKIRAALEFNKEGVATSGQYFYFGKGRTLTLEKTEKSKLGTLSEMVNFGGDATGRWDIKLHGKEIRGIWLSTSGRKTLPILLNQVADYPVTAIAPEIISVQNPEVASAIKTFGPEVSVGKPNCSTNIFLLKKQFLSLSSECVETSNPSEAHPNKTRSSVVYDLKTKKVLKIGELFSGDIENPLYYEGPKSFQLGWLGVEVYYLNAPFAISSANDTVPYFELSKNLPSAATLAKGLEF